MTTAAIVVAAGSGQRFGNIGKSFVPVCGKPMAWWSLISAARSASVDELVLVCGVHSLATAESMLTDFPSEKPLSLVLGGARRQDSTLSGIGATHADVDIVAIHDAARPLVTSDLFDSVIAAASIHGAAIAAAPVSDTIKRVHNHCVVETIPRDDLVNVQTPQAFRKPLLLDAFSKAECHQLNVTDEASLIEAIGGAVHIVLSTSANPKVTYPDDLAIVDALMARQQP